MDVTKLMDLAEKDPKYIIESGFWVTNKEREVVPFVFNKIQNDFYNNRTYRDDITKASQLGMSTAILAIFTVKFLLVPNSWSVSISHESEATERLFSKVNFFLDHLPPWLTPFLKKGKNTATTIVNERMNSRFYIGTAGSKSFSRGDTVHYAHFSEIAFYEKGNRIVTNVMRAMPQDKDKTWAVKESTANGEGTPHHNEYIKAVEGKSEFRAHFFPFFDNPEYRVPGASLNEYTAEERAIVAKYPGKIDDEVLQWRRNQIGAMPGEAGRTSEEMFRQEFPTSYKEAFLTSGNPIFSREKTLRMEEKVETPIGLVNMIGAGGNVTIVWNEQGFVHIFEEPDPDDSYIIGADVGKVNDYCVGTVISRKTWRVVAKFRGILQPFDFGDELCRLGYYYNTAKLIPEINNMGQSTVDRIVQLKYPDLYIRITKRKDKQSGVVKNISDYGWLTTEKSKSLIVGNMQALVDREEITIPDKEILDEMKTFIKTDKGTMEASTGNHDDCVMATMIGYYGIKMYPYSPHKTGAPKVIQQRVNKYKKFRRGKLTKRQR